MNKLLCLQRTPNIYTPILLCPDFDIIYILCHLPVNSRDDYKRVVINNFHAGNKIEIDLLVTGESELYSIKNTPGIIKPDIGGKVTIISNDGDNTRWQLSFDYQGKNRQIIWLVVDKDNEWPIELQNINYIVGPFSTLTRQYRQMEENDVIDPNNIVPNKEAGFREDAGIFYNDVHRIDILRRMVFDRCTRPVKWYDNTYGKTCELKNYIHINDGNGMYYANLKQPKGFMIGDTFVSTKPRELGRLRLTKIHFVIIKFFTGDWYNADSFCHCQ